MLKFICVLVLLFSSACGKKSNLVNDEYETAKKSRYKNSIEGYNIENSKYDNFKYDEAALEKSTDKVPLPPSNNQLINDSNKTNNNQTKQ